MFKSTSFSSPLRKTRHGSGRKSVLAVASGKGFGKKTQPKSGAPKKVSRLGQPTKEEIKKQQAAIESVYGAQQQAGIDAKATPQEEVIDTVITDRMLKRVITFAGIPVVVGLLLFPAFWYLKVVKEVDLPMGLVFVVQSFVFGAGLLGISYGATSASWDPSREGSGLGWNEFRANLSAIMGRSGDQKR